MAGATGRRPELPDGDGTGGFIRSFGKQVQLFRDRAGLTQPELGQRVRYGEDLISSVEQGRRIPRPDLIEKLDRALDAHGVLCAMKDEVAKARYPAFFQDAAKIEAEAVELHAYDCHVLKGILQTEEYARAVFTMWRPFLDDDTVEQRVAARMARQQIFSRNPAPLVSFVIEEAVLRRMIGGRAVMDGQMEWLLHIGQKRTVDIQVMPMGRGEHAGLGGPFTLMVDREQQRVAYTEVQGNGRLYMDQRRVRELESTYGIIRAQALTPRESLTFIEKLRSEL
ncbi:helix-turn-helix transcriptional regulator [Streptomyces albus]|uniref:helix-turn-helix domain-containing protein n=1 Tax=Streptomyces albus TaxID=1888 RepID=UPI0004C84E0A|nr:helix-turn-helix transcriptional regulator [Streptomyces albus]